MKKTFEQLLENLTWYNLIEKLKGLFEAFWSRSISNIQAGENISIEGEGTEENPLVINSTLSSTGNYIPLPGTEEGQPITGDLQSTLYNKLNWIGDGYNHYVRGNDEYLDLRAESETNNTALQLNLNSLTGEVELNLQTETPIGRGIIANRYFDKQDDPNAYIQMQDLIDAIEALRQELTTP